jgi:hypothetical protein
MTGPADYFAGLQKIFDATVTGGGPAQSDYRVAGHGIRLNFPNRNLASRLTPALAHLQSPSFPAELEIRIWDEASACSPIPAPPWSWENNMSRGEIGGYDSAAFRIWFHIDSGLLSMVDLENNQALVWIRDAHRLPAYEIAAPLRMILQAWLRQRGKHLIHAAAVGTSSGGVILAGAGGSGKSTTSLACLASGLAFIGDDYCLLSVDPVPRAHSIYSSAKLSPGMLNRFPRLLPAVNQAHDPAEDKALLLLHEHFSRQLVGELPIRALLIPRVSNRPETTLCEAPALDGIRALAPSTMQQIAGPDASAWRAVTTLAKQVPSYRIDVGSRLESIPEVVGELLERLS